LLRHAGFGIVDSSYQVRLNSQSTIGDGADGCHQLQWRNSDRPLPEAGRCLVYWTPVAGIEKQAGRLAGQVYSGRLADSEDAQLLVELLGRHRHADLSCGYVAGMDEEM